MALIFQLVLQVRDIPLLTCVMDILSAIFWPPQFVRCVLTLLYLKKPHSGSPEHKEPVYRSLNHHDVPLPALPAGRQSVASEFSPM